MDSDSIQGPRYCLQYIILGNCTHPADCKDLCHDLEEEKTMEIQQETKTSQPDSKKNDPEPDQPKGAQFLIDRNKLKTQDPSKPIVSTDTKTEEEKKPKKKLQLKKGNDFTPTPIELPLKSQKSETPNDLPLKSTKSIESTKMSEADSFNVEAFYDNLDPEDEGGDFGYYNPDHQYGYGQNGYNSNYQQPDFDEFGNDDPAYFHKPSEDCTCCKGYVNSCEGGICDNLGYCYCYAHEMEEGH